MTKYGGKDISFTLPIARWAILDTDVAGSATSSIELSFIDPLLRRRLSPLARMAIKVAHDCAKDITKFRAVYASQHGDLISTTAMLEDLAAGEAISPTAFTMSVPNATAGLHSMLRQDKSKITAVSASVETLAYGMLEASLQLAEDPETPILLVYADEPVPGIYGYTESTDLGAHAIGMLLKTGTSKPITCTILPGQPQEISESQIRAFLRCLKGAPESVWVSPEKSWSWTRPPP